MRRSSHNGQEPYKTIEGDAKCSWDKGRKPTARAKSDQIEALCKEGVGATEIAKRLGIGRASVYRVLETEKTA